MPLQYVTDWSAVPDDRYAVAQAAEFAYWSDKGGELLRLRAQYYFYAGFYAWVQRREPINPFRVSSRRPQNYQLTGDEVEGTDVLDIGCGPAPVTLSLVHAARVSVVDPLANEFQRLQPFGWEEFQRVENTGAEALAFDDASFDFVHCNNVLDHTSDASRVLMEAARVLRQNGELLLACDVREDETPGGEPHPYRWTVDTLEGQVLTLFEPVRLATLVTDTGEVVPTADAPGRQLRWFARLRRRLT